MKNRISLGGILLVILCIGLLLIIGISRIHFENAKNVYLIYLDGKKIGLLENSATLYQMIDAEQESIKKEFKVDKVYPPEGLEVVEHTTYSKNLKTPEEIYNIIEEKSTFTIQGYTVTIKPNEGDAKYINILNKEDLIPALKEAVSAFVTTDSLEAYINDNQVEITDTGKIIENLYFEEKITIKEAFLDVEDMIIDNQKDLTKYLLFGTLEDQKEYTVKEGDTVENVAFNNELSNEELLIANPSLSSIKSLLSPGQKLNIGLINPLFSIIEESEVVEDNEAHFKTITEKDKSLYASERYVKQEGVNGINRVTEKIKYKNGEVITFIVKDSKELKPSVDKIIVTGTKMSNNINYLPPAASTTDWGWPTATPYKITSNFAYRWGRLHGALDISGPGFGSPIYSSSDGVVIETNSTCPEYGYLGSRCGGSYGNFVRVKMADGKTIYYAHMRTILRVSVGQTVSKGTLLGYMGSSGSSTGPHLHFEINSPDGVKLNPCKVAFSC